MPNYIDKHKFSALFSDIDANREQIWLGVLAICEGIAKKYRRYTGVTTHPAACNHDTDVPAINLPVLEWDDLIHDAVIRTMHVIKNVDSGKNAFAYVSQVVKNNYNKAISKHSKQCKLRAEYAKAKGAVSS